MTKKEAIAYAVEEIPQILPYLEKDNVIDLCNQILAKNTDHDTIANAFVDILGASDASFSFIFEFNKKLNQIESSSQNKEVLLNPNSTNLSMDKNNSHSQVNTNTVVSQKSFAQAAEQDNLTIKDSREDSHEVNKEGEKDQIKDNSVDNSKQLNKKTNRKIKQQKIDNLNDIEDFLKELELNSSKKNNKNWACNCQGTRHDLFELVPNCLSCGKIICVKEGLHMNNCSYCGKELLPLKERIKLIELIDSEKQQINDSLKTSLPQKTTQKKPHYFKIQSGKGKNLFEEQEKLFDQVERERERARKREHVLRDAETEKERQRKIDDLENNDPDLIKARDRLKTLLHYQDTSAERTKIIDNASDYDISSNDNNELWGSSFEKALNIKRQQRNLKKLEKLEMERKGRGKLVLDLTVGKNGKAVLRQKVPVINKDHLSFAQDDEIIDDENNSDLIEIQRLKEKINEEKKSHSNKLTSSVWDYEKEQLKFKRPFYVETTNIIPKKESESKKEWKPKVQLNTEDTNLEDNIIAVL
ncbi:uncharacterized protein SCODWIG_01510 [Saccharomycodes ludwigii]|uniref:TRIP4/RQT4 C2HC5-type zinc finger domain-containing protein n=1 Tax=Saccharomycodes ludwigii TaxID=36035 RepID=A0A376B582_9ASCO|nr:uncharacterized protein SCODWIG_01510 [Saccharomycodes ludwigii]